MIYLDASATTKVAQEVYNEMFPYFMEQYGNPSSKFYELAENAKKAIRDARTRISKLFKCDNDEIIFNSGATEGNNTIIKGLYDHYRGYKILTTKIEHSSINETIKYLESLGQEVEYLEVNKYGLIDIEDVCSKIKDVKLVCLSWVNAELGTIQPIEEIAKICFEKDIPFLVDATQAVGKVDIDLSKYKGISFITFSGHKIKGPKGIGAIIKRKNFYNKYYEYIPLLHGENEINPDRGGTLNVPGVVGLGKACELLNLNLLNDILLFKNKTIEVYNIFKKIFKDKIILNTNFDFSAPGIINIQIEGYNNELLLKTFSKVFAASTGSACSNLKPSRVLKEVGKNSKEISESIRISFDLDVDLFELINLINIRGSYE